MRPVWSGAVSFGLVTSLNYEVRPTTEGGRRPFQGSELLHVACAGDYLVRGAEEGIVPRGHRRNADNLRE